MTERARAPPHSGSLHRRQLSLASCLEDDNATDNNDAVLNDKAIQARFSRALQAAAGPLGLSSAMPNKPQRPRALSDPLSQAASHVFYDDLPKKSMYAAQSQKVFKNSRGVVPGESDWEDDNETASIAKINNVYLSKSAASNGIRLKALKNDLYGPTFKSTRFRGRDENMDLDEDDEEENRKLFASRRDTTLSRATEDTDDYPAFGLTELGKMERQIAAPK